MSDTQNAIDQQDRIIEQDIQIINALHQRIEKLETALKRIEMYKLKHYSTFGCAGVVKDITNIATEALASHEKDGG